jgi:hypothetical protein
MLDPHNATMASHRVLLRPDASSLLVQLPQDTMSTQSPAGVHYCRREGCTRCVYVDTRTGVEHDY